MMINFDSSMALLSSYTVEATDTEPPQIIGCPQSINRSVIIGTTLTNVSWTEPTAIDNSGLQPTITQSHVPGESFPLGSSQVSYIFKDQAGNQAMCLFMITIGRDIF